MKKLLTLGLTLALSGLMSQTSLAKSKDDDDKKHGQKSSKSEKKHASARPVVVSSERLRAAVPQRSVVIEQRDGRSPSSLSRLRGSSSNRSYDSGRYSNHNDSRYSNDNDRGWSRYEYYRAPSHVYRGWDRGRNYSWNNHDYRWYGGSWVIVTPSYDYNGYSGYRGSSYRSSNYGSVSRSEVRDVQIQLTRRGYSPGPVDGDMGYRTRSAIEHFQSDSGLAVTGRIDRTLLAALDRG